MGMIGRDWATGYDAMLDDKYSKYTSKELYGLSTTDCDCSLLKFIQAHTPEMAEYAYKNAVQIDERVGKIYSPFKEGRDCPYTYCTLIRWCLNYLSTGEGNKKFNEDSAT
jgi:hypothetical protein